MPGPEPSTSGSRRMPSVRSETARSPRARRRPKSSPKARSRPNGRSDRAPNPRRLHRTPARSVAGDIAPGTVPVEVFIASHFFGNIVAGLAAVFILIAIGGPIVEIIGSRQLLNFMIELIASGKPRPLTGDHQIRGACARGLAAALPNRGVGLAAVGVHIKAVFASALNVERQIGSVDLEADLHRPDAAPAR